MNDPKAEKVSEAWIKWDWKVKTVIDDEHHKDLMIPKEFRGQKVEFAMRIIKEEAWNAL